MSTSEKCKYEKVCIGRKKTFFKPESYLLQQISEKTAMKYFDFFSMSV